MKKFLCLILVVLLSVSVFAACGNKEENKNNENEIVSQDESTTNTQKDEIPVSSDTSASEDTSSQNNTDKSTVSEENTDNVPSGKASDFYLVLNGTNEESILYHTGTCPLLKDREVQKISWEMIEMLEFRHCAKCNPPKYEGYVE